MKFIYCIHLSITYGDYFFSVQLRVNMSAYFVNNNDDVMDRVTLEVGEDYPQNGVHVNPSQTESYNKEESDVDETSNYEPETSPGKWFKPIKISSLFRVSVVHLCIALGLLAVGSMTASLEEGGSY